jgi:hypothetical protein
VLKIVCEIDDDMVLGQRLEWTTVRIGGKNVGFDHWTSWFILLVRTLKRMLTLFLLEMYPPCEIPMILSFVLIPMVFKDKLFFPRKCYFFMHYFAFGMVETIYKFWGQHTIIFHTIDRFTEWDIGSAWKLNIFQSDLISVKILFLCDVTILYRHVNYFLKASIWYYFLWDKQGAKICWN